MEGPAAENGEFAQAQGALKLDEIKGIVTAMADRTDCLDPDATDGAATAAIAGDRASEFTRTHPATARQSPRRRARSRLGPLRAQRPTLLWAARYGLTEL